jgi:ABC-2 type transport system permease protein
MKTLFAIFKKDLRLLLTDRAELAVLILMPLAFILPVGFAMGGGDGYGINRDNTRLTLPVANLDSGSGSVELVQNLQKSLFVETIFDLLVIERLGLQDDPLCAQPAPACDKLAVRRLVETSRRTAAVIIPAGFSQAVENGQPVSVTFLYDPGGDAARRQQLEGVLKGAAIELSLGRQVNNAMADMKSLAAFAPDALRPAAENAAAQSAPDTQNSPAVRLVIVQPSNFTAAKTPDTYQQTIPGYTVMFVFFLIGTISSSMIDERRQGTFRRLLAMPVSKTAIVGGKLLSTLLIGLIQVAILFGVGVLVFHMDLGREYLGLALLSIALVACAVSIGLAASTTQIGGVLVPMLIVAALLGGCMFPIDLMPPFLRVVSYAVPHRWALQGFQNLIVRGQGLLQVLPQIGVLLAFTLVFFLAASRRIDYEEK